MPPLRDLPIKRKLTALFLGVCGLALICFVGVLFVLRWSDIQGDIRARSAVTGDLVADHAARSVAEGDAAAAQELFASLRADPTVQAACIVDLAGNLVAHYGTLETHQKLQHLDGEMIEAGSQYLSRPVVWQGRTIGRVNLQTDFQGMLAGIRHRFRIALGSALLLAGGLVLLALRPIHRLLLEPIEQLSVTAAQIAQNHDYGLRARVTGRDELGRLAQAFNEMLAQVQARDTVIQATEKRFRQLFQRSPTPMWLVTLGDWRVVAVNDAIEALYGYDLAEFGGRGPDLLARALDPLFADTTQLEPEGTPTVICQHQRKDGRPLTVQLSVRAHDYLGDPALLVQVLDLTEQRRAEAAYRASEERFRAVVENLSDGLLLHDWNGRILYANPSMARLVRCEPWEFDTLSAPELLPGPPESGPAAAQQEYEAELRRPNGTTVSVSIRTSPLTKANGETIATVAVVTDLSARKAAAAEIAQSQARLIEVSRLAGMAEVATGVLHNVGNVLNSVNVSAIVVGDRLRQSRISGLQRAVRLLEQHAGNLGTFFTEDPKGKLLPDYLGKLYWQLENERNELVGELAGLTKNLGHIKEIVAMQQTYAKVDGLTEAVSPAVLLEDALRLNEESLVRNSVTVDRDYDATAPTVTVDKHKVLEILVNLITNARHAVCDVARPDRKIRVRVAQTCNRRVSVEVQDNGVGIPQDNLVRIFQHGFTTKKNGHGFGLHSGALAARQMGGSLTVNSEGPGQGATFKLELPVGETKPAPN